MQTIKRGNGHKSTDLQKLEKGEQKLIQNLRQQKEGNNKNQCRYIEIMNNKTTEKINKTMRDASKT